LSGNTQRPSPIDTRLLPIGCESFGVSFEKWKIPLDAEVEMYEALAILPIEPTILLKKKFALALADMIRASFTDDR
jgi:hypothetical protein